MTCSLDYCDKKHYAKGVCFAHYQQKHTYGLEEYRPLYSAGPQKKCDAPWCERLTTTARLCTACNKRRNRYGLTHEEYVLLGDDCSVCHSKGKAYIDHDHATGKVRGLLCQGCNSAIGHAQDDSDRLRKLADYIDRHQLSGITEESSGASSGQSQ